MSTYQFVNQRTFEHEMDHGFCTVCGAVWPCSRARRAMASRRDEHTLCGG
ncbi:MAG TPA: hypothetical protein VHN80_07170 [Kineosporiaceae bacterium]|jgi:hypothetical protein|nr:hypothetical protein [Kineosporiaceae bacterium]